MSPTQGNEGLDRLRRQLKSYAEWGQIMAPVLMRDCLRDLLRRKETLTVFRKELQLSRGYAAAVTQAVNGPYGSLDVRNLELLLTAEELGRFLVSNDLVPNGVPEDVLKLARRFIPDVADGFLPEEKQAHLAACRAVGWMALSLDERVLALPLPDMIREYVEASNSSARYYAKKSAELIAESAIRSQLPSVAPVITESRRSTTFVFSRNRYSPHGVVIRSEEPGQIGNRFVAVSFHGAISGDDVRYDGSYVPPSELEVLPSFAVGQIASSVLCAMGLNPREASVFCFDGRNPIGFHHVIEDILWQVERNGQVSISGQNLADWIDSCNPLLALEPAHPGRPAAQLQPVELAQLRADTGRSGLQ